MHGFKCIWIDKYVFQIRIKVITYTVGSAPTDLLGAFNLGGANGHGVVDDEFFLGGVGMGMMTIALLLEGSTTVFSHIAGTPASLTAEASARISTDISIGGCNQSSGCIREQLGQQKDMVNSVIINDVNFFGVDPIGIHFFTLPFTFGDPVPFNVSLDASASGGDSGTGTANFGSTLRFGIYDVFADGVSIFDSERNLRNGFSVTSGSGYDYTDISFLSTIPLPGTLPLFASGLGLLGFRWRKRHQAQK